MLWLLSSLIVDYLIGYCLASTNDVGQSSGASRDPIKIEPLYDHDDVDYECYDAVPQANWNNSWWEDEYSQRSSMDTGSSQPIEAYTTPTEEDWVETLREQERLNGLWRQSQHQRHEFEHYDVPASVEEESAKEGTDLSDWKEYADILQDADWQEETADAYPEETPIARQKQRSTSHFAPPDEMLTPNIKMLKKSYRRSPSFYVASIQDTWSQYVPLYMQADPNVSTHQAKYRLFSRLDEDIATKLASDDPDQIKEAVKKLQYRWNESSLLAMDKDKRAAIQSKLIAYFNYTHKITASNICRLGMPLFPKDREQELYSDKREVYGPALELLREIANKESYARQTRNARPPSRRKKGYKHKKNREVSEVNDVQQHE